MLKEIIENYQSQLYELFRNQDKKAFAVGDKVIIYIWNKWHGNSMKTDIIKRITPTGQISLEKSNIKFKNGREMGSDSWSTGSDLYHYDQTAVELYNKIMLISKSEAIVLQNVQHFTETEVIELAEKLKSRL